MENQPTQSPKQPSHLPLAIISVILSGLIFGLLGYWYGADVNSTTPTAGPTIIATATTTPIPSADPTASWQTYRNETIGLSFKYPSSTGALNILTERSTTGAGYSSDANKDTKLQLGLRTADWTFGRGAYFLDGAKPSFVINDSQFKPVKTLTVDSQKVYLADSTSLPAWANPTLGPSDPLGKNSLAAFVTFTGNDGKTWGMVLKDVDTSNIDQATFEQIIGTMKFGKSVNATTVDPIAGWKTYTSNSYGFHVKYPSDWTIKTGSDASIYGANAVTASSPETTAKLARITGMNTSQFADLAIVYYPSITDTYRLLGGAQPKTLQQLSSKLESPSVISLAGTQGYEGIALGDAPAYQVLLQNNGHIYQVSFIGSGHSSKTDLTSTEKQILSSFTFNN